jgi:hypothetical protein
MKETDIKALRAARRARAMADAAQRDMWSGGRRAIPNKKREADRKACRGRVNYDS